MFKKYATAPLDRIIFMDNEKQEEWDNLSLEIKECALKHLHGYTKKMSNENAIELLCHVINDLVKRIDILEGK